MKDQYLLSVCIPVYNAEAYLEECLQPLIAMGDKVQIILSEDGSRDNSVSICRSYAEQYGNVVCTEGPNGGPSTARNRGLSLAKGEYIVFCDADDWLETEAFTEFEKIIGRKKYDLIHFGVTVEDEKHSYKQNLLYKESKELTNAEYHDLFSLVCGYEDDRDLAFPAYGLVTCKFYRKEILEGLKFDPSIVGEDTLYAVEAMKKVKSSYYLAGNYYHYRIVSDGYSHKPFPTIVPMAARMLRLMAETLEIGNTQDEVIKKAYYYHARGKFEWCVAATGLSAIRNSRERAQKMKELCNVPEFRDMLWKLKLAELSPKAKIIVTMLRLHIYGFPAKHPILK